MVCNLQIGIQLYFWPHTLNMLYISPHSFTHPQSYSFLPGKGEIMSKNTFPGNTWPSHSFPASPTSQNISCVYIPNTHATLLLMQLYSLSNFTPYLSCKKIAYWNYRFSLKTQLISVTDIQFTFFYIFSNFIQINIYNIFFTLVVEHYILPLMLQQIYTNIVYCSSLNNIFKIRFSLQFKL
jgi:hypothetical protein